MSLTQSPTWKKLEAHWEAGFETLHPFEQQTLALWWLEAEVMNGGLEQFFWNSSGDLALLARAGLQRLRQPLSLQALDSALALLGEPYPVNREARMARLSVLEQQHGSGLFSPFSTVLQDLPEDFVLAAHNDLAAWYVTSGSGS